MIQLQVMHGGHLFSSFLGTSQNEATGSAVPRIPMYVSRFLMLPGNRGVTIHLPHNTIRIVIRTSRYDTYRDTFNQTDRLTHTQPGHAISLFSC